MFVPYNIKKLLRYTESSKFAKDSNAIMRNLSPCLSARKKEGPLEPLFFWGGRAISHHYMQDYKLNLLLQNMVFLTSAFSFCFSRNVHIKFIL